MGSEMCIRDSSQGDLTEFTELGDDIKGAVTRYYRVTEE